MSYSAHVAGLSRLYHYERFVPEYLTDVLVHKRLHCSDPSSLNDPWDCRPWFAEAALESTSAIDGFIEYMFSFRPTVPTSQDEITATKAKIRSDPEYRRQILDQAARDFLKMLPGRWRIYCMTPHPDSILMWSHYADNHRGICLEFAVSQQVIGSAMEVQYLDEYPKWTPQSWANSNTTEVLLTKSDAWKYENEFRIIALADGVKRPVKKHPLILRNGYLSLSERALLAVIAGCEADYGAIKALVNANAPVVKVKRAVRAPSMYRIQIED